MSLTERVRVVNLIIQPGRILIDLGFKIQNLTLAVGVVNNILWYLLLILSACATLSLLPRYLPQFHTPFMCPKIKHHTPLRVRIV